MTDPNVYDGLRPPKPKWWIFPAQLPNGDNRGFENREDKSKVRGALVLGQNVTLRNSGMPELREGSEPVGTEASNITPVKRAWTFETREGVLWELKAYSTGIYYKLVGVSDEDHLLKGGFTTGLEFGYGNIGESSGLFHSMFCNGTDPWYEFNGAYATVLSVGAATITMSESGTFASRNFYSSGTRSVIVNGVEYVYTGGESTATLTGIASTVGINVGDIIVQSPRLPTFRIFIPFLATSAGAFVVGETVNQATSAASGVVQRVDSNGNFIVLTTITGTFDGNHVITGATSGATATTPKYVDTTLGPPLAQIIMAHDSRLHCFSAVKKSVWKYSMLDDPYTWTVFDGDTSGGSKDLAFSGPGTAFGKLNQTIVGYKQRSITCLSFVQGDNRIDVPLWQTLVQSDDKGTTLGAISQKSTFATPYGMVSVTEDSRMILLSGITNNNQPDYVILSDVNQPVFEAGNLDDSSGICKDGVIWYTFKSDGTVGANDTVLAGDLKRKTVDAYGNVIPIRWDVPIVGWSSNDFTTVQTDDSTDLHFHSSLNSNTYRVTPESKVDNNSSFTANFRTWAETFGAPHLRKRASAGYIDIKLLENSDILSTFLLDEEGYTDQISKRLLGSLTQYRYGNSSFNPIGASVFGSQKIGSNGLIEERNVYRFYYEFKKTAWFFNLSLQMDTDTENSDFEVVEWGVEIVEYESSIPKALAI